MISTADAQELPFRAIGPAGFVTSLGLHALLLAGIVLFVRPAVLPDAVEQVVMVDLIAAPTPVTQPPAIAAAPDAKETPAKVDADTPDAPKSRTGVIVATKMLAAAALADPRNAEARQMLDLIETSVRREQVCGIEAMEQITRLGSGWSPECVISDAFAETRLKGSTVTAQGAAVMSGPQWYRLEYRCTLGVDLASVTAFRFRIGDAISIADRDRLGLGSCM